MKKTNRLLLISLSTILMSSCLGGKLINNTKNEMTVHAENKEVSSIKDAITLLHDSKNFTVNVSNLTGPITIASHLYFTENAFYDDFLGDEYGYIEIDGGVASFDLYNRKVTTSTLLKDENGVAYEELWNSSLFYGFDRLNLSDFAGATGKTFTATSKRAKLVFMNMFKISQDKYQYVDGITMKLGDTINSLEFEINLTSSQEKHSCKIANFGTTSIDVVDKYLATHQEAYQPDEALAKVIELFSNFNYSRYVYDEDYEDNSVLGGKEMFNEDYFYTDFTNEYIAKSSANGNIVYNLGVLGLNKSFGPYERNDKTYGPYLLKGSYYFYITDGVFDIMTTLYISTDPYVPNVYNYPTFLKAFSNSQYVQVAGSETQYYTSKLSVVNDFVSNFQLTDSLAAANYTATGVFIEYFEKGTSTYSGTTGKETVVMSLQFDYYGATGTINYVFTDFNNTYLDCISEESIEEVVVKKVDSMAAKDQAATEGGANNE